jgi:hypothetical protein
MIGMFVLVAAALSTVSQLQSQSHFRCEIFMTIPHVERVEDLKVMAIGPEWDFGEQFQKLTGTRVAKAEKDADGLQLLGLVDGAPNAEFTAKLFFAEDGDGQFGLDWTIYETRGKRGERTIEGGGVAKCAPLEHVGESGKSS